MSGNYTNPQQDASRLPVVAICLVGVRIMRPVAPIIVAEYCISLLGRLGY